jgi:quercetin dioxygenase-like cupin family protein
MENFLSINSLHTHEMIPGFKARFVHTEFMTISYWEIQEGSFLPEHVHHHEQISQVLEGRFEFTINGISQIMEPGRLAVIPPNVVHSGKALTECKVMDIFYPVRDDYRLK